MQINFLTNSSDKSTKSIKQNQGKTNFKIKLISSDFLQKNAKLFDKEILKSTEFEAKFLQSLTVAKENNIEIYLGCGAENKLSVIQLNKIGARILLLANASKFADIAVEFCFKTSAQSLSDIAFGAVLQSYRFNKYFNKKIKDKELKIANLNFYHEKASDAKKLFASEQILAENIFMVRDLVSEPANILNPESYADFCKNLKVKNLEIEILGEKEMTKLGMNSLLGVGVGSQRESKMVILKYNGGKKGEAPLAFIGKGVTFDTGGISIKPANNMEDMKTDMAGSAVVVGLLKNLAQRNAKVNAVGLIGLVENMPSGTAQRPGDVLKSMSGQTIEVINTDAEGRLVLADVLHYANTKFKPKFMIDLATLTGAIIVALADVYAGLFSNDDNLSKQLSACGEETGERVWRLPLGEEYDEMINSDIADMKNVGSGRGAGSITAAQFLHRFVGETKWVHLDIAGVAWKGKGDALAHKGATGYGVRLLNELVKKYEK